MVSVPYLSQLHPTFTAPRLSLFLAGASLILRAADGGFTRSHRHLFSLPKAPPFARVGSEPRPPEERSHTGTRFAETDARALRPYLEATRWVSVNPS